MHMKPLNVFVSIMLVLLMFNLSQVAHAGPWLSQEELVRDADVVLQVTVDLEKTSVEIEQWLKGVSGPEQGESNLRESWIGECLPDADHLRRWITQNPDWEQRPLWREALELGKYSSVIFLKRSKEVGKQNSRAVLVPHCQVEARGVESWTTHSSYAEWMMRLRKLL